MKVAVSADGRQLDSLMDQRFGRAAFFLIVDAETMEFEAIDNGSNASTGGAGITSAQTIVDKGAGAVITGNVGPNAMNVLNAAEIKIYRGSTVSVRQNIDQFKAGTLEKLGNAVPQHFGMGFKGGK